MAVLEKKGETPLDLIERGFAALPAYMAGLRDADLGPAVIRMRQIADRTEAVST